MVLVFRIFAVTIDAVIIGRQALPSFQLVGRRHLSRLVAQIPFVHDIQERCKLSAGRIAVIDAVIHRNKTHMLLPKQDIRIETGL